jgi:hypothetical protein
MRVNFIPLNLILKGQLGIVLHIQMSEFCERLGL